MIYIIIFYCFILFYFILYKQNNDGLYLRTDFSVSGTTEVTDYYGIAFFLDINSREERGLLDYMIASMYVENVNYENGLKKKPLV